MTEPTWSNEASERLWPGAEDLEKAEGILARRWAALRAMEAFRPGAPPEWPPMTEQQRRAAIELESLVSGFMPIATDIDWARQIKERANKAQAIENALAYGQPPGDALLFGVPFDDEWPIDALRAIAWQLGKELKRDYLYTPPIEAQANPGTGEGIDTKA